MRLGAVRQNVAFAHRDDDLSPARMTLAVGEFFKDRSDEQDGAAAFFSAAGQNLREAGERAGVRRIVVGSIIGVDRFLGATARMLRAARFHEFVALLAEWVRRGEVTFVPSMRTQLFAASTVARALVDPAAEPVSDSAGAPIPEVAGPREESLFYVAKLLVGRRGDPMRIEGVRAKE